MIMACARWTQPLQMRLIACFAHVEAPIGVVRPSSLVEFGHRLDFTAVFAGFQGASHAFATHIRETIDTVGCWRKVQIGLLLLANCADFFLAVLALGLLGRLVTLAAVILIAIFGG